MISSALARVARRPRHALLAAVVLGLILGPRAGVVAIAGTGAALLAAFACHARGGRATLLLGVSIAVIAGATIADLRLAALDRTTLRPWFGHAAVLRVVVLEQPRERSFGRVAAVVRIRGGPGTGERVLVRAARLADVGRELFVRGGLRALPAHEGAARLRGAHALVDADAVTATGVRRGGASGFVDRVRERADRALERDLPPALGALARGMVLGEGAALPRDLSDDFKVVGLTHVVAASGANVALLATFALAFATAIGIPLRPRLWLVLAAIALYVPLAGGGPSIQRAGVMGAAALVATLSSSPASRWYALLLAAAVTLAGNPRAVEDPGWQLSFVAVVALIVLVPRLRATLGARLPAVLTEITAVTVAASVGTAPLIAIHFDRVSLVSIPVNVVAAPVVPVVVWLGTLAALVGQLSPLLASLPMAVAAWPLAFLVALAAAAAPLPYGQVAPAPAIVAGIVAVAAARTWRRRRRGGRAAIAPLAVVVVVLGVLVATRLRSPPTAPPGLVVSALDVGQGDATLFQHDGKAILLDAGPVDGQIVRQLRDAGVRRLDVLVVTHAQADHDGGAAAVLEAYPVGLVLDGRDGVRSPDGDRFAAAARRRGVRLVAAEGGQRLRAGPLRLDVLGPRAEAPSAHAGVDPNQRAIVAELRDGSFSMLLTADAESDVLATLPLEPVDVLKVSHHGSADDGLPALLERLRPTVAVIEVGKNNGYGHPAPSTLSALRAVGQVLRTDRDGTVRLHVGSNGIRVVRRG